MRVDFGLLSILSVAFLLFFVFQGSQVELHSLDIGFSIDRERATITIDPAFVVWGNPLKWSGHTAFTMGNVMVVQSGLRDTLYGDYLLNFEGNHIKQFYALGWWVYLAQFFIPIDPCPAITDWNDIQQPNRIEWLPPSWWVNQWHFLSISMNGR